MSFVYPQAHKGDVVDDFHGTKVADPYRWLEDSDSPETVAWIEEQNRLTFGFLEKIPERDSIRSRLTQLWDYEKFGLPFRKADRYFLTRNDGLQNHFVLYTMDSPEGDPRMLLNPNEWSEDGTVSLAGLALSEDSGLMAFGKSTSGTDWSEWFVMDLETGETLDDHLRYIKFSGASWTHDGKGFFYSRYPEPEGDQSLEDINHYHQLHYHRLGTPQSDDELVYHRPDEKEWGFGGFVTEDGDFLIISVWKGTHRENQVFYRDLRDPDSDVVELIAGFDAHYGFIGNDGDTFWFVTDLDAPNQRIIGVDTASPDRSRWTEVVPEAPQALQVAGVVGERFFCSYLEDAHSVVRRFHLDGSPEVDVELPGLGTVVGFSGRRDHKETFYLFTSFTDPGTVYRYDIEADRSDVFRRPDVGIDLESYETKQVFYNSKDGTRVPMFITHRKGIELDGNNPTLLYGYGGFNIPNTPVFGVSNILWMEMGGIYAVANIRGGGEYGKGWHEAGMKLNRQNVFDDFIAAAEHLIASDYTSTERLAIAGGSNGGLLVGACMTQRPDLFGAVVASRGVLDMLRFHKFTIGWAWTSDYGSPDDPEEFEALHSYSPLHNIKKRTAYPATLIVTADHDDRVVPGHSFKFAATLQGAQGGDAPTLIRIETKAGHGMGTPTAKLIEEIADTRAFLAEVLGVEVPAEVS
jgi:prolyl oligopeptidase